MVEGYEYPSVCIVLYESELSENWIGSKSDWAGTGPGCLYVIYFRLDHLNQVWIRLGYFRCDSFKLGLVQNVVQLLQGSFWLSRSQSIGFVLG